MEGGEDDKRPKGLHGRCVSCASYGLRYKHQWYECDGCVTYMGVWGRLGRW